MPLELGMAMARRFLDPAEHDWLVMVPNGPAYHRVASDLVGFDLEKHDGSIAGIVRPVVSWLSTRKEAALPVTPREVLEALPAFQTAKDLKAAWSLRRVHTRQARPGRHWNGCRAACNEMPGSDRQAALPETTRATWLVCRFVDCRRPEPHWIRLCGEVLAKWRPRLHRSPLRSFWQLRYLSPYAPDTYPPEILPETPGQAEHRDMTAPACHRLESEDCMEALSPHTGEVTVCRPGSRAANRSACPAHSKIS